MKRAFWFPVFLILLVMLSVSAAAAEETVYQPKDLPVLYVHIDGGQEELDRMNTSPDHSYRCTGTLDILVPEGYSGEFEGRFPQESVEGLQLDYIRGRGNGTWACSKLPYKIKLDKKRNLFGMGAAKTWVLLANYYDNSMIRNWLTAWLGEKMGMEYTPQGMFVELVMEDEFLGCYYLCEQVQIQKNRLALDELTEGDTELPEIQGGYLLDFNPDEEEGSDIFETSRGKQFANNTPSFNTEKKGWQNDVQKQYIRDYIQRAEDAVFAESGQDYTKYLDLQSLADYWWIQEFTVNGDAFMTDSAHMYKKRFEADGSEGKLYFGPLWDFDESWGNALEETMQAIGFNNTVFIWVDALRRKPEFCAYLEERWKVMDAKLEEIVREGGVLDQTAAVIRDAWYRDCEKWASAEDLPDAKFTRNYEEETEHIRGWINLRRAWINRNLDRLDKLFFTLSLRGEGVEERDLNEAADTWIDVYMIETPELEGKEFIGWRTEDGTPVEDFFLMDRDITLTAQFSQD